MILFTKLADWLTYGVFGLGPATRLGGGVHFFIEDTTKIFVMLAVMIYCIGLIRAGLPVERIRAFLSGRSRFAGYILAVLLGAVTPFCSCSSIPLFLGFTAARIPIGITMAFLVTSPMINEAAVVMLGGMVGWKLTGVYVGFGMLAGILAGFFFDAIRADRFLDVATPPACGCCGCSGSAAEPAVTWKFRHKFARKEVADIFRRIWLWVVGGIALGALLHGFVPDEFISQNLGGGQWWSVPLAVMIGIPSYANATGVIPVIGALIQKGLPVGTAFAFMLSTTAASLPEFIMLKKVMSIRLLIIFAAYLLVFFTLCGWTLNLIF
ncbi:MAG: permease [Victivallaceae bacterium]|nr:permease [Victivallaceae bacterium]